MRTGRAGTPSAVGANARTAVQDSSAAGYIGELDSEPTRASVPITNHAGMLQVSPGAGGVDFTRPAAGYPDSPDRYRPSGDRNFARTVPADDVVVRAAADWASELGVKRLMVISDGTPFPEPDGPEVHRGRGGARRPGDRSDDRRDGEHLHSGRDGSCLRPGDPDDQSRGRLARADRLRSPRPESATRFILRPRVPREVRARSGSLRRIRVRGDGARPPIDFRVRASMHPSSATTSGRGVFGAERTDSVLGDYSIDSDGDTTECMIQRYRGDEPLGASCRPSSAPRADPRSPAPRRSRSRPSRASPGSGRSRSSAGRGPRGR